MRKSCADWLEHPELGSLLDTRNCCGIEASTRYCLEFLLVCGPTPGAVIVGYPGG